MLHELGYQDGVRESGFVSVCWNVRMNRGHNKRFAMAEDFLGERDRRPLDDAWWASKRPAFEAIDVLALVCASWSDQGLHTRGSLLGFEGMGSKQKWLFTHGRRKWETFYGAEARETRVGFFDRFLKGEANGCDETPRVRAAFSFRVVGYLGFIQNVPGNEFALEVADGFKSTGRPAFRV